MRISRLTQDNQRTQGAQQRVLYRQRNPEHLRAVERLITDVSSARVGPAKPRVIALGAGACTELPLERLARESASVLLVDVDVAGMLRARDELPAALRGRVDALATDITGGVSSSLEHELRSQPWDDLVRLSSAHVTSVLDAAASCLDRCSVPDPPQDPRLTLAGYDIVISDLVLTQLFSLPLLDLVDTLSVVAPDAVDYRDAYPHYREAALRFRRRVAQAHLSLLTTLLAPGGACLLITDVIGYLLPARKGAHAGDTIESLPTLPPNVLDVPHDLAEHFKLRGRPFKWRWEVTPPTATLPGRAYDVCGVIFQQSE